MLHGRRYKAPQTDMKIEKTLVNGRYAKADVFIALIGGRRYVVKDFSRKGWFERNFIGRLVISREFKAYTSLSGLDGLPAQFERLSPFTLAVEYLDGRDLGSVGKSEISGEIISSFEEIISNIHRRGWVHLDLQRRSNILLVEGRIYIVDLASALNTAGVPFIGGLLTKALGLFDRLAFIKLKNIYAPETLSRAERRWIRVRNLVMPSKW